MAYNISHRSITEVERVEEHYTKKDGAPVRYVCTSEVGVGTVYGDVFYRATPHPYFGNRYFMLYENRFGGRDFCITNADSIEDLKFHMIEHEGKLYYSRGRHDFRKLGDSFIDGGRSYCRSNCFTRLFKVVDGEFEEVI